MNLKQYLSTINYRHLDHHKLWDPNEFAVHCFKIIMYSIQVRIEYIIYKYIKDYVSIYIYIYKDYII